ncbi:hypothetical protein HFN68_35190 [Rhizobium laguerreae]|uniref:TniQ family protein n=1 Tax=Rhizobium laguerreae TaxID=1076926 RepID=UPI001C902265|nr:TniQ family protein [Rhizobium laguerreae]MBY3538073.1 hypothetical protein [Rhizobium laguerreae]
MSRLTGITPFVAGESLTSNCSRIAAACGFDSARKFAAFHGFDFKALASGDPAHVERFANLIDRPVAQLEAGAVHAISPRISMVRGEALNRSLMMRKRLRFCPLCLSDDDRHVRARRGFRKFGRLNWEILPIRACTTHEVELMQTDSDVPHAFVYDFALAMRSLKLRTYRLLARPMEVDSLQIYVERRLEGRPTGSPWLDSFTLSDAVMIAETVGAIDRHGVEFKNRTIQPQEWSRCAGHGHDILQGGEPAFRSFVSSVLRNVHANLLTDNARSYVGSLYDLLFYAVDDFAGIAREIAREVFADHASLVPTAPAGRCRKEASLLSISVIADKHGVAARRLKTLLLDAGIVDRADAAKLPGHILVDHERCALFAAELRTSLDQRETREALGADARLLRALASELGFVEYASIGEGLNSYRVGRRVPIEQIERALDILRRSVTMSETVGEMVSLSDLVRITGCSFDDVVRLLARGMLGRVALAKGGLYHDVRLDPKEVQAKLQFGDRDSFDVQAVARWIGVSVSAVKLLVEFGVLEMEPPTRKRPMAVPVKAIIRFINEYISSEGLAKEWRWRISRIRNRLDASGVGPAFVTGKTSFYRRADLSSL